MAAFMRRRVSPPYPAARGVGVARNASRRRNACCGLLVRALPTELLSCFRAGPVFRRGRLGGCLLVSYTPLANYLEDFLVGVCRAWAKAVFLGWQKQGAALAFEPLEPPGLGTTAPSLRATPLGKKY